MRGLSGSFHNTIAAKSRDFIGNSRLEIRERQKRNATRRTGQANDANGYDAIKRKELVPFPRRSVWPVHINIITISRGVVSFFLIRLYLVLCFETIRTFCAASQLQAGYSEKQLAELLV